MAKCLTHWFLLRSKWSYMVTTPQRRQQSRPEKSFMTWDFYFEALQVNTVRKCEISLVLPISKTLTSESGGGTAKQTLPSLSYVQVCPGWRLRIKSFHQCFKFTWRGLKSVFVANILLHLLWNCLEVLLAHLHRVELIWQKTHHLTLITGLSLNASLSRLKKLRIL